LISTLHWLRYVAKLPMSHALEKLDELKNPDEMELEQALSTMEELPC